MISAFGVEHISKKVTDSGPPRSKLPISIKGQKTKKGRLLPLRRFAKAQVKPGVFKPITELGNIERLKVTNRLKAGHSEGYGFAQAPKDATGRKIWGPHRPATPQGRSVRADMKAPEMKEAGTSIAHAQPNGRGGGLIVMTPEAKNRPDVINHELQHLAPRRNPHTFGRRLREPIRAGREEGRADFLANGKATPGSYPGKPEFQHGYNEVQSRMAAGRKVSKAIKPQNLKVLQRAAGRAGKLSSADYQKTQWAGHRLALRNQGLPGQNPKRLADFHRSEMHNLVSRP